MQTYVASSGTFKMGSKAQNLKLSAETNSKMPILNAVLRSADWHDEERVQGCGGPAAGHARVGDRDRVPGGGDREGAAPKAEEATAVEKGRTHSEGYRVGIGVSRCLFIS
jgi:hypothetical protein